MNTYLAPQISVGRGLLAKLPELLKEHAPAYRYAILTDSTVEKLYGEKLLETLKGAGLNVELFSFPAGEASKSEETKQKLDHALLAKNYGRDTVILALGGGVVGDLAGFVASTYMRGISYVQIPTTVLSMLDSSIGGKVGINTPFGKNTIGAFWQPSLIVADLDTLQTLPEPELRNGWFEALKIFLTMDTASYELAKKKVDLSLLGNAMQLKMQVVAVDERELNLRSILNFGHSIGQAVEKLSDYKISHGFAVALGMLVEARVSVELGHLSEEDWEDLADVLKAFGIHADDLQVYSFESIWDAMQNDKKNREGKVKLVLLKSPGAVVTDRMEYTHLVPKSAFQKAWNFVSAL